MDREIVTRPVKRSLTDAFKQPRISLGDIAERHAENIGNAAVTDYLGKG